MSDIKIDKTFRSNRRTIGLQVTPAGELFVRAPRRATNSEIQAFIQRKQDWIIKHQTRMAAMKQLHQAPKFETGESFYFLGVAYPLIVSESQEIPFYFNDGFYLDFRFKNRARILFLRWYLERANEIIPGRVRHYAVLNNLHPRKIRIGNARRRWGSCGYNGNLNFTWRLVLTPLEVIDYIVVHELAHLIEKNHSKKFWLRVMAILPNFESARKWLRENERSLEI